MARKHVLSDQYKIPNNKAPKQYDFGPLMVAYSIGRLPRHIQPTKVVINLVEIERDGFGRQRIASWKDDMQSEGKDDV
jgi:hypothetical protein